MKKIIFVAIALAVCGQLVSKADWFWGAVIGMIGLLLLLGLVLVVLFACVVARDTR